MNLLSGQKPYEIKGKSFDEIIKRVCETEPVPPSLAVRIQWSGVNETSPHQGTITKEEELITKPQFKIQNPKSLHGDLDNIILKALRKDPTERYGSVQHFSEDIFRYLRGLPILARPQTWKYRFEKYVKRHSVGVIAAALVLISLVGGISVATWQAREARRERTKAEQRFKDVRQLANSIVFEFHDSIEKLPGSTPTRELLIRRALEYLDKLAGESEEDQSLQMELADAYEKIGDIQGGLQTNHLGHREKAEESYRKSLAVREKLFTNDPQNIDYQRKLASSYQKISNMMWVKVVPDESLKYAQMATSIYQKLLEDSPDDQELNYAIAKSYSRLGYLLAANNRTDESLETSRKAIDLFEKLAAVAPQNRGFQESLSSAYDNYATILDRLKQDFPESLKFYRKSEIINQKLAAEEPENIKFQRGLGSIYFSLSDILEKIGSNKESLDYAQKSEAIFLKMLSFDPQNEEYKQIIAAVETQVSLTLVKTGRAREAINKLKNPVTALEKLLQASPNDEIVRYRIAISYEVLGKAYSGLASEKQTSNKIENWLKSREYFQKSYEIYKDFRDKGKTVGTDASVVDTIAGLIGKCDTEISKLKGK